jgi:hypothetical protein
MRLNYSFFILLILALSNLTQPLAQEKEQIIPPNTKDGIVLKDFSDLQRVMNIGQYSTIISWPFSNHSSSSTLTIYEWYTTDLQQYPVVFSIGQEEKPQRLSYFKLPTGGGGGTCLCSTTISFESLEQLPNQLIRLEIEETYRLEKRDSYNDRDVFASCAAQDCIYYSKTRLAYIFDVSSGILQCLVCDLPLQQKSYLEFEDEKQIWQTTNEQTFQLRADIFGDTLIVKAVTDALTDQQQPWPGSYTLH